MAAADKARQPLTVLIPTRNRTAYVDGQLRLFSECRAPYRLLIADSSDAREAAAIRRIAEGRATYRNYPPEITLYEKLVRAMAEVETPLVLLSADRKITFPHAIDAALDYLAANEEVIGAQGYVLDFATRAGDIDIRGIRFYVPGLGHDYPLQRYYHLMQRYQPGHFAVYRTAPLRLAAVLSAAADGAVFQEVIFMAALALLGKTARLPNVFTLQGPEFSFNPLNRRDPIHWLMHDSVSFFSHYLKYRSLLLRFMADHGITPRAGVGAGQLVDMIHTMWLNRNLDNGVLNYAVQALLDERLPPLPERRAPTPIRAIEAGDRIYPGHAGRRYIWRHEVTQAEPRDEIRIAADEIARVNAQLDAYFGD